MTRTLDLDLTDPKLYQSGFPHEVFTELRRRGPVHLHPPIEGRPAIPSIPFWSFVAHPEIQRANRDWKTFAATDGPMVGPDPLISAGRTLLTLDPPDHLEMRRIISSEFTPRMIGTLEQRLTERTAGILAAAAARPIRHRPFRAVPSPYEQRRRLVQCAGTRAMTSAPELLRLDSEELDYT